VLDNVEIKSINDHFVLLARTTQKEKGRLGFIITKKVFKRAVDRNRVRRHMREEFRKNQEKFVGIDIVAITRKGQKLKASEEVLEKIGKLWKVLRKRCRQGALS
jgi:ribonuclease P protein component